MSEKTALSDDVFNLMLSGGDVASAGFHFTVAIGAPWKRSFSQTEQTDLRQFIIAADDETAEFMKKLPQCVSIAGWTFGHPGLVFVDGEWKQSFRYMHATASTLAHDIVRLERMLGEPLVPLNEQVRPAMPDHW